MSGVENLAIARVLARDRRPAGDQGREPVQDPRVSQRRRHRRRRAERHRRPLDEAAAARAARASARTSRRGSASWPPPARCSLHQELLARVPRRRSSTCCACRASVRRPWRCSTASSASVRLDDLAAAARRGRLRAIKGMGAEGGADPQRDRGTQQRVDRPPPTGRRHESAARARGVRCASTHPASIRCRSAACAAAPRPAATSTSSRSARRPAVMDGVRPATRAGRAGPRRTATTKSSVLLARRPPGRPAAGAAETRGAAMQYFTGSKAHNIALRDRALQRGFKLNEYGLFRARRTTVAVAGADRGRDLRGARARLDPARAARESRRDDGRRRRARCRASSSRATSAATCTCTRPRPTAGRIETMALPRATPGSSTSRSPTTARRWRWPTASTKRARSRTPRASARSTRHRGITVLAGIECDILADGTHGSRGRLPRAARRGDRLGALGLRQEPTQMTERILRAPSQSRGSTCSATRPAGCCSRERLRPTWSR